MDAHWGILSTFCVLNNLYYKNIGIKQNSCQRRLNKETTYVRVKCIVIFNKIITSLEKKPGF